MDNPTSNTDNDASILLQKPRKWTATHLNVARVRATDRVTIEQILGSKYTPEDGGKEWETLSKLAYVSSVPDNRENIGNPFNNVFRYLMLFKLHGGIRTSESILIYLVSNILWETNVGENFIELIQELPRFNIPQSNIRGTIPGIQIIARRDDDQGLSVPLIVLSVRKESDSSRLTWHEAPKALILAAIAYSRNPRLEHYDGFVICMEGPFLYVSQLKASKKYMSSLFECRTVSDDLPLHRSRKLDILDCDDRREIVRMLIGVLRYLDEHDQAKILGDYEYQVLGRLIFI